MAKEELKIYCENNGQEYNVKLGMSLKELLSKIDLKLDEPVLAALVDNRLKQLDFKLAMTKKVQFIGYSHPDGRRSYIRSLCFVLQNAVRELFPDKVLVIDHSLPMGLYCELKDSVKDANDKRPVYFIKDAEIDLIRQKMQEIIDKDLPFTKQTISCKEAEDIFIKQNQNYKAELCQSLGRYFYSVYYLDGQVDTFHGPLVPSTGYLKTFNVMGFSNGFLLQLPALNDSSKTTAFVRQSKIAATLKEYSNWCEIIGANGVGTLNKQILNGEAKQIINISEALHERKYADIADQIYSNRAHVKIVFIAGPSSSGKTSSSLRLAQQCRVLGLNPKVIELDNYFVDRSRTPKDENGEYDFESLYAMDLELLNEQLNDLLSGKEIEVPKYDFKEGKSTPSGKKMTLGEKDILVMEGIHALNPEMVSQVDQSKVFRVYASALTSLNLDENNNISTSDNRLLRRMVRDNRVRGIIPEQTIMRWASVRRGEAKNIFPFQENADAIFNSALLYELPMLKYYAEPLLRRILPSSPAYTEAIRLLKFLDFIVALQPEEIAAIPPTSIMREFIGGQTL